MIKRLRRIFCWHIWKNVKVESLGTERRVTQGSEWLTYTWGTFERALVTQECVKCREIRFIQKRFRTK